MKTNKIIISTILLFICFAFACVKSTPNTTPNCGDLPCPTATGANVVSCYVNGKPYIAKGGKPDLSLWGCQQGNHITSSALGGPNTTFSFRFCDAGYPEEIFILLGDTLRLGEYKLNSLNRVLILGTFLYGQTDTINQGSFNITFLSSKIVAGNFNFNTSTNVAGSTVFKFTQGNFDIAR
jgi:hypothetical protein